MAATAEAKTYFLTLPRADGKSPKLLNHRGELSILIFDMRSLLFLSVNDRAVEQYGYSREEFLAMTVADILNKSSLAKLMGYMRNAAKLPINTGVWKHHGKAADTMDVEMFCFRFILQGRSVVLALINETTEALPLDGRLTRELRRYLTGSGGSMDIVTHAERRRMSRELDRELGRLPLEPEVAMVWGELLVS